MEPPSIYLNGIDATTGLPLWKSNETLNIHFSEATSHSASSFRRTIGAFSKWISRLFSNGPSLGISEGDEEIDPSEPCSVGWAIVVAADAPPEAVKAADRLFDHRLRFTNVPPDRCKRLTYKTGCTFDAWMRGLGAHASDVEPTILPYFVTLMGSPASIPFETQFQLSVNYAVGRIAFDDPSAYSRYVNSIITYEKSELPSGSRDAVYWGPRIARDAATCLSTDFLVRPLYEGVSCEGQRAYPPIAERRGFRSHAMIGREATARNLIDILHGKGKITRPTVLLAASHGMGWPAPHPKQTELQGALIGQEWAGPGTIPKPSDCFKAADLEVDAQLQGLMVFLFACFGAGVPKVDHFLQSKVKEIADRPFIAALPQQLLGHPRGGALAVVGHVERAWAYSIQPPRIGPSLLPFRNFLSRIMKGEPVAHAMRDFGARFASASMRLLEPHSEAELATLWLERNDARNYIVLGDSAARIRVSQLQ